MSVQLGLSSLGKARRGVLSDTRVQCGGRLQVDGTVSKPQFERGQQQQEQRLQAVEALCDEAVQLAGLAQEGGGVGGELLNSPQAEQRLMALEASLRAALLETDERLAEEAAADLQSLKQLKLAVEQQFQVGGLHARQRVVECRWRQKQKHHQTISSTTATATATATAGRFGPHADDRRMWVGGHDAGERGAHAGAMHRAGRGAGAVRFHLGSAPY
jgi:hypothetical protein